jgi:hypothetical protein
VPGGEGFALDLQLSRKVSFAEVITDWLDTGLRLW